MDDTAVDLIGALALPVVGLLVVLIFFRPIRGLLAREDVELRTPVLSIASKGRAKEALVRAARDRAGVVLDEKDAEQEIEAAANGVLAHRATPQVLWVDDRPSNNRYERATLEALGMFVDLATSTDDAVNKLMAHPGYDVIISDMGRRLDPRAGYTLLGRLREAGVRTPVVIYASSRAAEHVDRAVRHGAAGCTNHPGELVELVTNALRRRSG